MRFMPPEDVPRVAYGTIDLADWATWAFSHGTAGAPSGNILLSHCTGHLAAGKVRQVRQDLPQKAR
jgi:hypothetical protein